MTGASVMSGAWNNNGFLLISNDYSFPYAISLDAFSFYSVDAYNTLPQRPQLIVTYR